MRRKANNPYTSLLLAAHAFVVSCGGANPSPGGTTPLTEELSLSTSSPNALATATPPQSLEQQIEVLFERRAANIALGPTDLARLAFIERCERTGPSILTVVDECAAFLEAPAAERTFLRARLLSSLGRHAEARDAFARVRAAAGQLAALAMLREAESLFDTVAFRAVELGERDADLLVDLSTLCDSTSLIVLSLERRCQLAEARLRYALERRDCRQDNACLDTAAGELGDRVRAQTASSPPAPDATLALELRILAATALAARPAHAEAAALLFIQLRAEHSAVSARADYQLHELQRRVPANLATGWVEPATEKLARAASEAISGNRARARELASAVLAGDTLETPIRCAAAVGRLEWSDSAAERRDALRGVDRFCAEDDSARRFFVQGDAQLHLDDDERGIATLEHALTKTGDDGYRDRAALRLVQVHLRNGRDAAATSVLRCALVDDCSTFVTAAIGEADLAAQLTTTPSAQPSATPIVRGGENAEQHELAVLYAVLADAQHRSEAVAALEQAVVHAEERERTEGLLGRAEYWLAKTTSGVDPARARALFQHIVDAHGLTFYGHLAVRSMPAEAQRAPVIPAENAVAAAFAQRFAERAQQPAFRLACAFLRVGEIELAKEALRLPEPQESASSENTLRDGMLHSLLMQRAGYLREGISMARAFRSELSRWPSSDTDWGYLQVAYPKAYGSFVEAASALDGVRADLVFAISREESSFDPNALSTASAHGVMQIIEPTARRMASSLGISLSPQLLRDPETNIRLGTRYLRSLLQRYDQRHGFVPAAYNAGEGAVDRWLRAHAVDPEFDLWVERIPYTETRRYTRRVLQTLCVYSALSGSDVPILDSHPSS